MAFQVFCQNVGIRPVSYVVDINALNDHYSKANASALQETAPQNITQNEGIRQTGFIAQEVEKSANELGFEFSGVDKPQTENALYGLRYAEFVLPLVKAVQEQQSMIDQLNTIVSQQQQQIDELKKLVQEQHHE